jgi:glycosyltransferase involved in cell wall biosynthesis
MYTQTMKIGIDVRLWNETGVGRYIRNLIREILILDGSNDFVLFAKPSDYLYIKDYISDSLSSWKMEGGKWKIVTTDIRWHSLEEQTSFPKILLGENLDLMHFPYFSLPIAYNKPFIVTIHDLIIYHYPTGKASTLPKPIYKLKHLGYKTIIQKAVKNAAVIIVPSNFVKDDLKKTLDVPDGKIVVTAEGIDQSLKEKASFTSILEDQSYFLYVGNAYPHKNLKLMIDAFIGFCQNNSFNGDLILVGKDDFFYQKLEDELITKNIKNVHILHEINDLHLHVLYTNALALIAPSIMEGFGLVPLEAMANKCLVIASDIPAHREVCNNTVLYFNPKNVNELELAMAKVNKMGILAKRKLRVDGLRHCRSFSWEKMAKDTLALYYDVIKSSNKDE